MTGFTSFWKGVRVYAERQNERAADNRENSSVQSNVLPQALASTSAQNLSRDSEIL